MLRYLTVVEDKYESPMYNHACRPHGFIRLMKTIALSFFLLACVSPSLALATQTWPRWPVGFWVQTLDEDGHSRDETLRFLGDGSVVIYGPSCQMSPAGGYHVYGGKVYATFRVPKGFVSAVYVPSKDRRRLTYTSPRTGNNSVYTPADGCVSVSN